MQYDTLATEDVVAKTAAALKARGVETIVVETGAEALAKIKTLLPPGASVMNGSSVTLEQIGYIDHLKSGSHGWNNLRAGIVAQKDPAKQRLLRQQSVLSDYYLGSVHGLAETGEFVVASNTGSQLPHVVFTSSHLIFVVGTQKIVPTLADAIERLETHVFPLEDQHMKNLYGMGTALSKIVIFKRENPASGRTITMILVNERLGF